MKKIIILDPLSPYGHADINKVIVNLLESEYAVTYCASEDYEDLVPDNCSFIPIDRRYFHNSKSPLVNRINYSKAILKICKLLSPINADIVLVMSYDIVTFAIWYEVFSRAVKGKEKIFFLNHNNIDECENSRIKSCLFSYIAKKSHHIVYEEFIKKHVEKKYGISCKLIRHNINNYKMNLKGDITEKVNEFLNANANIKIVMLSGNKVGITYMHELMEMDKDGYLKNHGIKIYLKNKDFSYESDNLTVSGAYLSDIDYSRLFATSTFIFLPYDVEYYKFRISGVYFDALTFLKPVIYSQTLFFEDQKRRFGDIGLELSSSIRDTLDKYNPDSYRTYVDNIRKARLVYDDRNVIEDINSMFN